MANAESEGGALGRALVLTERALGTRVFASDDAADRVGEGAGANSQGAVVTRATGAADAVRAAAAEAGRGGRASVLCSHGELVGALDALANAASARAAIAVHVMSTRDRQIPGGHEIAPALDVGAGVVVTWNSQDAVDMTLAIRRAAEDSETPFVHVCDASRLAGDGSDRSAAAPVVPGMDIVGKFLASERSASGAPRGDEAARKRAERSFTARVPFALASAMRELTELTGRTLAPFERRDMQDADEIIVTVGSAFGPAAAVAQALRTEGHRAGVIGVRSLRPFFAADTVKQISRARAVIVLEPLDVALAPSGPVAAAVKAAFADALTWAPGFPGVGRIPPIVSVCFATVDTAISEREVRAALAEITAGERARRVLVFGSDS